jgi:hypothetical protein
LSSKDFELIENITTTAVREAIAEKSSELNPVYLSDRTYTFTVMQNLFNISILTLMITSFFFLWSIASDSRQEAGYKTKYEL